jgi:DNA-binding transcriptional LysR family regulator
MMHVQARSSMTRYRACMDFSLSQLRGFVAVAEHRHFGRAASALNLTQPPLSRQIQSLERSLGVTLLQRGPRGVTPTAAGEVFLRDARRILALVGTAPDTAQRVAAGRAGRVRVAFTSASSFSLLAPLLAEINSELAQLQVTLIEMESREQLEALDEGRIDLGLLRPPLLPGHLASQVVHREPLVVALPTANHLAAEGGPLSLAVLREEVWVGYSETGARYLHERCAALLGAETFQTSARVNQVSTALALVRARRGLALVPASASAMVVEGVELRELLGPVAAVELHACWNPDASNPALINVVGYLRSRMLSQEV